MAAFKNSTDIAREELDAGIYVTSEVVAWRLKTGKIKLPMRNPAAWNPDQNLLRKCALSSLLKSGARHSVQDQKTQRLREYKQQSMQGSREKAHAKMQKVQYCIC